MDIVDRIGCFFVSSLIGGLGCLMIKYPHLMDGDYPTHTSARGGFISLLIAIIFIIVLKLIWNAIGGSILILFSLLSLAGIVVSLFPDSREDQTILDNQINDVVEATETNNNLLRPVLSQVGKLGKNHLPKRLIGQANKLSQPIVSQTIKLGGKYIQNKLKERKN